MLMGGHGPHAGWRISPGWDRGLQPCTSPRMLLHMGFWDQIPWTSVLSSVKWGHLTVKIIWLISVESKMTQIRYHYVHYLLIKVVSWFKRPKKERKKTGVTDCLPQTGKHLLLYEGKKKKLSEEVYTELNPFSIEISKSYTPQLHC